jgi:hypothetical protein
MRGSGFLHRTYCCSAHPFRLNFFPATDQLARREAEVCDLKAVGCRNLYQETGVIRVEPRELDAALDYAREGDIKLDRLAHLCCLNKTRRSSSEDVCSHLT